MAFDLSTAKPFSDSPAPKPNGGGFDISTAKPYADEAQAVGDFNQLTQPGELPAEPHPDAAAWKEDFEPKRTVFGIGEEGGGTVGDAGVMLLKGAVGLPQGLLGIGSMLTGGHAGRAAEGAGVKFSETQKMLDEMYSPAQKAANAKVQAADGFVDTLGALKDNPSTVVTTVGESLPSVLGGGAIAKGLGLIPKVSPLVAGAIGEGVMGAGSAAEQIRGQTDDGLLTGKQQLAAAGTGVGTALFGAAGGKLAGKFGAGDIDSAMAGAVTDEARRGFASRLAAAGISEGAFEELPQSVQEQMWQNFALDKPLDEGVGSAAAMGLAAGTAMGSGFEAGRSAANALGNKPVVANSQEEAFLQQQEQQPPQEQQEQQPPQEQQAEPLGLGYNPRRMITMPDGTTAWEDQIAPTETPAVARQHPGYAELNKTADELEAELGQGESVEDQLAKLESDLRLIPYEPTPVQNWAAATAPSQDFGNGIDFEAPGLPGQQPELALADYGGGIDYVPETVSRADSLAGGVENAMADYAKGQRMAGLPPGFNDPRLARDEFRQSIDGLVNTLEKGGAVSYLRNENDVITGRTGSVNPDWLKSMAQDSTTAMSVEDTRAAVAKALKGERLGVRQTRVVKSLLDEVSGIRSNYAGVLRDNRQQVAAERAKAFWDTVPNDGPDDYGVVQEYIADQFDESNYLPESSYDDRATAELADQAMGLGASWDDIDAAIASGNGQESTKALGRLIYGLRNEHRKNTTTGQPAAGAGGIPGNLRPGHSSAPAESLAGTAPNTSQAGQADRSGVAPSADAVAAIANESPSSPLNDLPEPTEAQKEAGNYRKPVVRLHGLDIAIENPKGSVRRGVDPDGKAWESPMHAHYGYVKRSQGADGDAVDVFVGDKPDSQTVFVIDQQNADGTFDEHKVVMGTNTMLEAKVLYKKNYQKGWQVGPATAMSVDEFKTWLKNGDTTQPLQPDHFAKAGKMVGKKPNLDNQKPNLDNSLPKSDGDLLTKELKRLVESGDFETDGSRAAAYAKRIQKARDGDASALAWAKDWLSKLDGATNLDRQNANLDNKLPGKPLTKASNVKEAKNLPGENPERLAAFARGEIPPNTTEKYAEWVKSLPAGERAEMFSSRVTPTARNAQYMAWAGLRKPSEKAPEREEVKTYGGSLFDSPKFSVQEGLDSFVDKVLQGEINPGRYFDLGVTSPVLQALGAKPLKVILPARVVTKAAGGKHDISADSLKRLGSELQDPMMVFDSKTQGGDFVVLTTLQDNRGLPVVVALAIEEDRGSLQVNRIASVHAKESYGQIKGWVDDGLLAYQNKQKSRSWFPSVPLYLRWEGARNGLRKKVLTEADIVKPAKLSVDAGVDTGGVTKADVEPVIARIVKSFGGRKINVMAIDSLVELPPEVKAGVEADGVDQSKVRGIFHKGKIFINLAALNTPADIERVILHELAHDGLAKMFGPEIQRAMGGLYLAIGGDKTLRALATKHAMPLARYEQAYANASPGARIALMTEELLAHIAQDSRPTVMRKLKELVGAIRLWLREHWFLKSADVSESELFALLKEVRQYSGGDGGIRFSLADAARSAASSLRASLAAPSSRAVFSRFADLGKARVDLAQTVKDVSGLIGFDVPFTLGVTADMSITTPMRLNLDNGVIEVNSRLKLPRDEAAQYLMEEVLHGIDVLGPERTLSASSKLLDADGAIYQEAMAHFDEGGILAGFLAYPLDKNLFGAFSDDRVKAELFARLGVIYLGDPQLLSEVIPSAYRAFHAVFGLERSSPVSGEHVFRKVWKPSTGQRSEILRRYRADPNPGSNAYPAGARGAGGRGLGGLRGAFGGALLGSPFGKRVSLRDKNLNVLNTTRPSGGFSASGLGKKAVDALKPAVDAIKPAKKTDPNTKNAALIESLKEKTLAEKVSMEMKRQFTSAGLLGGAVHSLKIESDGIKSEQNLQVRFQNKAFEDAVKKQFGKAYDDLTQEVKRRLNTVMRGDPDYRKGLSAELLAVFDGMRADIQHLTRIHMDQLLADTKFMAGEASAIALKARPAKEKLKKLAESSSSEGQDTAEIKALRREVAESDAAVREQIEAITAKIGTIRVMAQNFDVYLHRSYRAFDDPKWPSKVPAKVVQDAVDYIAAGMANGQPVTAEIIAQAEQRVNEILHEGTAFDNLGAFITQSKVGQKDLSIFKRRKQIAPQILALLGEYEDAPMNYSKSMAKMANLVGNHHFLVNLREKGLELGLISTPDKKPLEHKMKIAGDASAAYAPLNGYYTTPEFLRGLEDFNDGMKDPTWLKAVIWINGIVKTNKTVLAPTTAMRNIWSSAMMLLGDAGFSAAGFKAAFATVNTHFTDGGEAAVKEYVKKLRRLGVIYDSANYGEIQEMMEQARKIDNAWVNNRVAKGFGAAFDVFQRFYGLGDDFFKIMRYEFKKEQLIRHRGMTEQAAELEAAERIRNITPTYSMVPKSVRKMRRIPVLGSFMSFPAEALRNQYHLARYAYDDFIALGIKNPMVLRQFAGLALNAAFLNTLAMLSFALNDTGDDDEPFIKLAAPPWSKSSMFFYFGRDEKGNPVSMDMSWLDPYSFLKKPFIAMLRAESFGDAVLGAAAEFFGPFLAPGVLPQAVIEAYTGQKDNGGEVRNSADSIWGQIADTSAHLAKAFGPGFMSNITNFAMAYDDHVTRSGKRYTYQDEALALLGFRFTSTDTRFALKYKTYEYNDQKADAAKLLTRVASDPNRVSDEELQNAFEQATRARERAYKDMAKVVNAAKGTGLQPLDIQFALRLGGASKDEAKALAYGKPMPDWKPGKNMLAKDIKGAAVLFGEEVEEELKRRRQKIRELERKTVPFN